MDGPEESPRPVSPASRPGSFGRVWLRAKALWHKQPLVLWRVVWNDDELRVVCDRVDLVEEPQESVRWEEVTEVAVFKVDYFTVDQIRLCFTSLDDTSLEIHEEMEGFLELVQDLPSHLLGCRTFESWFDEAAFPAFEANWTAIWSRAESSSQ